MKIEDKPEEELLNELRKLIHANAGFKKLKNDLEQQIQAQQETGQKYQRLVGNLKDEYFFYTHDFNGVFTHISPSITNVLGYSQEVFLCHFSEFFTDNPINKKGDHHTSLTLQGKQQPSYEIEVFHKDGSIYSLEVSEFPVFNQEGKVIAVEGISHDITARKRVEQRLARLSEELRVKNREMEDDLNMAREVQMAFLTKQPKQFPNNVPIERSALQFYNHYLPATILAGDFFNILPISDHEVGLLICDVMGHGARASLLTAYIYGLIEELIPIATDTVAFMKRLNTGFGAIMEKSFSGIFATAFYLIADIKSSRIRYTNAGHPSPFVLRRSKGIVEKVLYKKNTREPALGLLKDYDYSIYECPIANDDIVLFFTDGLYEGMNIDGQMFGEKRLLTTVQNLIGRHPEKLLDEILDEIRLFSGATEFKDDICLLAMHIR